MNKNLVVALGLAVLATPAFATKARLQALGEDSYGSFYVNDNRNIWLNAANINNHSNLMTYEFGGTVDTDNAKTPRGEGGVTMTHGNLVYGVHFGGASNTSNNLRIGAGLAEITVPGGVITANGTSSEQNNVDVFVGGDAGMKWGANIGYAKESGVSANPRSESLRTRLGVISGDTQAYANINLINTAKGEFSAPAPTGLNVFNGAATFQGKLGYQIGATHNWNGSTLFADYRQFDAEGQLTGQSKKDQGIKQLQVGIGRVEKLSDKTSLFSKASFVSIDASNDNILAAQAGVGSFGAQACEQSAFFCKEYKSSRVPVVVGLENEAASWLTLRASVSQVVWGTEEDKSNERSINGTTVNAGATLKFGELSIDGVVGNTVADGTFSNAASTNTVGGSGTNGTLRTDNLMTRVSMTYKF